MVWGAGFFLHSSGVLAALKKILRGRQNEVRSGRTRFGIRQAAVEGRKPRPWPKDRPTELRPNQAINCEEASTDIAQTPQRRDAFPQRRNAEVFHRTAIP